MKKPVVAELATLGCVGLILLVVALIGISLLYTLYHQEPPPTVEAVSHKPLVEFPIPDSKIVEHKFNCSNIRKPLSTVVEDDKTYKLYDCDHDGKPDLLLESETHNNPEFFLFRHLVASETDADMIKISNSYADRKSYVTHVCPASDARLRFWKDMFDGGLYVEYVGCKGIEPIERYLPGYFLLRGSPEAREALSVFPAFR